MDHIPCEMIYFSTASGTRSPILSPRANFSLTKVELTCLYFSSEKACFESDGGFDITVKPLMDLWGFYRKRRQLPTAEEISAAKAKAGFDKLKLDHNRRTVQFTVKGMALDLGGIAKGYALDRAAQAVVASGIDCGIIDLGGNLKLLPQTPPGKNFYTIGTSLDLRS